MQQLLFSLTTSLIVQALHFVSRHSTDSKYVLSVFPEVLLIRHTEQRNPTEFCHHNLYATLNWVCNLYLSVFILIATCTHKIPGQKGIDKSLKIVHHLFFTHSVSLLKSCLPCKLKFHQFPSARMINFSFPFSLCPHKKKRNTQMNTSFCHKVD